MGKDKQFELPIREIKFRAWDKKVKEMFYNVQNSFHSLGDKEYDRMKRYRDYHGFNEVLEDVKNRRLILMQYTGLKDKNGREIYEGDIIAKERNDKRYKNNFYENSIKVVEYFSNRFSFKEEWEADDLVTIVDNYVVIGNIFENPELLCQQESEKNK